MGGLLRRCWVFLGALAGSGALQNCSDKSVLELPRVDVSDGNISTTWSLVASLLASHGAVVVEKAATAAAMEQLAHQLEADPSATFRGEEGSFAGHDITRNSAKPLGESTVARELATHPGILSVVESYLGPWCKRIRLGAATAMYVEPPADIRSPPAPPQVLHRDDMLWPASGWMNAADQCTKIKRPAFSVSVMWAVTPFTTLNGATRLVVGSHLQCPRTELPSNETPVATATLDQGSAVLWAGGTFHGAGARASADAIPPGLELRKASTRKGMFFFYNVGWVYPEHNFFNAIPLDVIHSFSPMLRGLMGYDGLNAKPHPWYTGPVYSLPYLGGRDGHVAGDAIGKKQTA